MDMREHRSYCLLLPFLLFVDHTQRLAEKIHRIFRISPRKHLLIKRKPERNTSFP